MLGLPQGRCDLSEWSDMVERQLASTDSVCVALVGKYVELPTPI